MMLPVPPIEKPFSNFALIRVIRGPGVWLFGPGNRRIIVHHKAKDNFQ
jgi:hypothetical protein